MEDLQCFLDTTMAAGVYAMPNPEEEGMKSEQKSEGLVFFRHRDGSMSVPHECAMLKLERKE